MADQQRRTWLSVPWLERRKPGNVLRGARHDGEGRDGKPLSDWRATIQSRLMVTAAVFAVWTIGIEARLLYLQVIRHDQMMARADSQQMRTIEAPAKRGDIVDRNGHLLAFSVDAGSVFADPAEVEDPDGAAALLCDVLDECRTAEDRKTIARNLRKDTRFVYIARKVSPPEEERIRTLEIKGINLLPESRRFYPNRELLSHVLGYVGTDNLGLEGLESTYDTQIKGLTGKVIVDKDAHRRAVSSRVERQATSGASLELTVDQYLQNIAERELRRGVQENRAAGGSVVIMDPFTGEILALANWPTYNPNAFGRADKDLRRNRAVQDLYEPGSTFKIVTASAALEEGVMHLDQPIDCSPGYITFGGRVISDVHRYGVLSFTDVIVKSSNVGAIRVGMKLGPERLSRYVTRFGFGQPTSPDFRGENAGIVWNPALLDASALASVSMGYQVGVTPLQMATAVSSVANGGTLYEPHIVRAVVKDGRRTEVAPKAVRRTISERTAAELTAVMEAVVERGTATAAKIDGYTIAGKTGTAAKIVDGRYSQSDYNASFVGFLPSRKPQLTIIVVIDSPKAKGYFGGVVAAPIFQRIADASLRQLGIPPNINALPPVLVARNSSEPEALIPRPVVATNVERALEPARAGMMPDLRGLSAREALRTLTLIGMTARMNGDGFVLDHTPAAGEPLGSRATCVLKLGRRPAAAASGGATQ
jgi:cell division protein FtsI (penicillin-binding protein 3)